MTRCGQMQCHCVSACHIPCRSTASEGSSTMQPTEGVSEQPQVTSTRAARERRLPDRLYDSIVMVSVEDRPVVDDKKSFQTSCVFTGS